MGCIHLYFGDGKGKTTAAMGLAIRGFGRGKRVLVTQFLKGGSSGELESLFKLDIDIWRNSKDYGFFPFLTAEEKEALIAEQNEQLQKIQAALAMDEYDMIILDELITAAEIGAVEMALVEELFANAPYDAELVLTGHSAPHWMVQKADYVTEMKCVKHPYQCGQPAREGIEY